ARHRRSILRLHDDEAHLGLGVFRRNEEVHMAEDTAARLVEDEVAKCAVMGDEARLLPQGVAWRRRHAADDDIAHLALGVTADDLDRSRASHIAWANPLASR